MKGGWVILRNVVIFVSATLSSGCTVPFMGGYGENGQSREAFAQYVEEVFRLQNKMTSEVMMLLESDPPQNANVLTQADQHMRQVCVDLNEYASRDIDGLSIGIFLSRRVEKSAIDCERAALAVKQLLN